MAIDYDTLISWPFEERLHAYSVRDTLLYALGLGLGGDEKRPEDIHYVYEHDLRVLPTFAGVLGYPGFWLKDPAVGIDWRRVLNGEQGLVLHRPLKPEGKVVGRMRISEIVDKGPEKGALIYTTRDVLDAETDELIATVTNTIFARGDGGFKGGGKVAKALPAVPASEPELVFDMPTLRQAALIYRLSGDYNPLHADPAVARAVGYERPILHGAATWGIAGYSLLSLLCDGDPSMFRSFEARFSGPVFPGETLRTEIWRVGEGQAGFRCRVLERDTIVLTNGSMTWGTRT